MVQASREVYTRETSDCKEGGDHTNKNTIDQLVLAFPQGVCWVCGDLIIGRCGGWRNWLGTINIARKVISIKQGMDLEAPHKLVSCIEFGDIRHVYREKWLVVCVDGFDNIGGVIVFRTHFDMS